MKKKWLAGLLILAVLSAFAGGGAALAFAQTNDALGEVKVTNVQYSTAWEMIVVKTDSHTKLDEWRCHAYLFERPCGQSDDDSERAFTYGYRRYD